ncbi:autotransporter outer membrane beta-barrel domain-containing protein [Vibrio alfacsensis]|uniref:Autotransporter outer membrane beta-barrel domain-containing protein n=1 Tax=Vibrio alfacsensis TaxID=1074311 RepID=A0ABM6YY02_9VIBR|nr:autotransporter outer membrane beta-barrel domain-containing protein [Vibrio alfacsensis]AXY02480.1 autotransporter outer membrane beta-barrel domain-containing protein [Vibrio alfacsensis]
MAINKPLMKLTLATAIGLACTGINAKDISGLAGAGGADAQEVYFVKTIYEHALATGNQDILNAFASIDSAEDAARLARDIAPDRSGSNIYNAMTAQNTFTNVLRKRASEVITTDFGGTSAWVSYLGSDSSLHTDSDGTNLFDGYDSSSYGVAIGYDWIASNNLVVGLSVAQQTTDSDSRLTDMSLEIDSHHAAIYGVYSTESWYLAGTANIGWGSHIIDSHVSHTNDRLQGRTNSDMYGLSFDAYRPIYVGEFIVTPSLYTSYSLVRVDGYKEIANASVFALEYADQENETLNVGAGLDLTRQFITDAGLFTVQGIVKAETEVLDHQLSTKVKLRSMESAEFVMPVNQIDDKFYETALDLAWETNGSMTFNLGAQYKWSDSQDTLTYYGRGTISF